MSDSKRLFRHRDVYDTEHTEALFVAAMRENAVFQYAHCEAYRRILDRFHFDPHTISGFDDLVRLPFLPTLYLKHHRMQSLPSSKMLIKATSSGTSGSKSHIGFDLKSLMLGKSMVIRLAKYHGLWSPKPTNYIIFGYQPTKTNTTAISKTAFGFTFFAPAKSRTFALNSTKNGYQLDWDRVRRAMERCSRSRLPMRTIGFPAYTYFLLRDMQEQGLRYPMPKGSMVTLGGGWKQFYAEKVDKQAFYRLVKDVLDIDEDHVVEFFGAVEHPIMYTDCAHHHFHIPVYTRVIIRDPDTFAPVPNGTPGLVNLLTPMMFSSPLLSVMTDDLGVLHDEGCPCGIRSPWLEIIGRVGVSDIVTCAAGAQDYLKE